MDDEKPKTEQFQFGPRLRGKRVTLRLLPNHTPVSGILTSYNNYEIVLETMVGGKGSGKQIIYFKHSVVSITPEEAVKW